MRAAALLLLGIAASQRRRQFVVTIDCVQQQLSFTAPSLFRSTGNGHRVALELHAGEVDVRGSVDGQQGLFTLGTGT